MAKRGKGRWGQCESRKAAGPSAIVVLDVTVTCEIFIFNFTESQSMEGFQVLVLWAQWGFITWKTQ